MDVPVTSGFNCHSTDIATPIKRPQVVPVVCTPSTSILDTSMEVPVTSATKYPVTGIATPAKHPWVVPECQHLQQAFWTVPLFFIQLKPLPTFQDLYQ